MHDGLRRLDAEQSDDSLSRDSICPLGQLHRGKSSLVHVAEDRRAGEGREFSDLAAKAKVDVNFSSVEGYLVARVFAEGLRRAGKTPTRENLITALESINDFDLGGFTVNFSPTSHNASRFVDLTIIGRGGKFLH